MTSIEEQWPNGTPERAVAEAFLAFRRRDTAGMAAASTAASVRALAARVQRLDARDSQTPASSTEELTDSQAVSILDREVLQVPKLITDAARCHIVGHVIESRVFEADHPDARGFIWLECRVTGAADEWISVDGTLPAHREIADRVPGLAHVVCRLDFEFPGQDSVEVSPLEIATTQLIGGEWKLILDEWADVGLPGFRNIVFWIDPVPTTEAASDE
jgi:hypothetical protein